MNEKDIEIYETMGGPIPEFEPPRQTPQNPNRPKKSGGHGFAGGFAAGALTMLGIVLLAWGILSAGRLLLRMIRPQSEQTAAEGGYMDRDGLLDEVTVNKLTQIEYLLDTYYLYDENKANMQDGIIKGMLTSLGDPYTVFYNEKDSENLDIENTGKYSGVGAALTQDLNTMIITVTTVYKGSPAEESGIKEGDILMKADDVDLLGMPVDEAVTYIRGEEGTEVVLTVNRDGEELEIKATRRQITICNVEYEMLEDQTGYIKILSFDEGTEPQFKEALEDLKKQGMKALVMDLRNNGGGLVDICCNMLDELLPEGVLVTLEDKNGKIEEYKSTGDDEIGIPMAILVNKNSASASEIFTGALRDRAQVPVIGTTTYGKGIVQYVIPLGDGTNLKLTAAEYKTPNGVQIHKIGITPDYEVEENEKAEDGTYVDAPLNKALEVLGVDR